jgi:hypothetical protein
MKYHSLKREKQEFECLRISPVKVEAPNHIGITKSLVDNKVSLIMSNTGFKKEFRSG